MLGLRHGLCGMCVCGMWSLPSPSLPLPPNLWKHFIFCKGRWASVRYLTSEELFALDQVFGWGRDGGAEAGDFTLDFGMFTSGRKTATLLGIYLFPYLEIKMNIAGEDSDPSGPVVSGVARTGQCRPPSSRSMTCFPGITRLGWRREGTERLAGNTGGDIMSSHESKNVSESILGRPGVSQGAGLGDPEFLGLQSWGAWGFLGALWQLLGKLASFLLAGGWGPLQGPQEVMRVTYQ